MCASCVHGVCEDMSGRCVCNRGFYGSLCHDHCPSGRYGDCTARYITRYIFRLSDKRPKDRSPQSEKNLLIRATFSNISTLTLFLSKSTNTLLKSGYALFFFPDKLCNSVNATIGLCNSSVPTNARSKSQKKLLNFVKKVKHHHCHLTDKSSPRFLNYL